MNFCSTKSDESGSSWADHLMDIDMGGAGPGAPAFPVGAQRDKMIIRLRLSRSKNSYGIIVKHINDTDLVKILATNYFGNGQQAFNYLNGLYDTAIRRETRHPRTRPKMERHQYSKRRGRERRFNHELREIAHTLERRTSFGEQTRGRRTNREAT